MLHVQDHRVLKTRRTRLCGFVIGLAVAGLICSLATRTLQFEFPHSTYAKSAAIQPVRQHLDSDAVHWEAPIAVSIVLDRPAVYRRMAPTGPPAPRLICNESLYNRPPPRFS
ncbi:MAG TPA: hypothetical protein VI386_33225 [Candidatus Sulfotelmatobacter sp.]